MKGLGVRHLVSGLASALLIGAAAGGAAGSAIGQSVPPPPLKGRLVGGIVFTGRVPSGSTSGYQSGVVRIWHDISQNGRVVARQRVRRNRKYHFRLVPGRYTIVAHTRYGNCIHRALVEEEQTTHQNVYCVFH